MHTQYTILMTIKLNIKTPNIDSVQMQSVYVCSVNKINEMCEVQINIVSCSECCYVVSPVI